VAKLVTIKTFLDQPEAYVARSLLEQHGITAFLFDQNFVAVSWLSMFAVSGLRLMVVEEEAAQARAILAEAVAAVGTKAAALTDAAAPGCPACGSVDTTRVYSLIAAIAGFFVAAVPLLLHTAKWRCRQCGNRWRVVRD
jgi:predicted RNA-binding Zn-ribbon protein involved in translation (DUF1610 family)